MKTAAAFLTFLAVLLSFTLVQLVRESVVCITLSTPVLVIISVVINLLLVVALRCSLAQLVSFSSALPIIGSFGIVGIPISVWNNKNKNKMDLQALSSSLKRVRSLSLSSSLSHSPTLSPSVSEAQLTTLSHNKPTTLSHTDCSLHALLCALAHNLRYICVCMFLVILALRAYAEVQSSLPLRHALQDLLVNQELLSPAPQTLFTDKFALSGRAEMAQSDVTIVGVARDVADALPRLLPQIDALSQSFAFSQALFVEGDSADHSLSLLQQWEARSPQNRTILNTTARGVRESLPSLSENLLPREGRLALARNLALNAVRDLPRRTKYLLVLDLDIIGFNPLGVQDSFGRHNEWDAICANGVLMHGVYRDTYAFRARGIDTNHHQGGDDHLRYNISAEERRENRERVSKSKNKIKSIMSEQWFLDNNIAPQPLVVDSCFGGMAVYRMDAIDQCEYSHRAKTAPHMLDCEHVYFHQCLRETNHAKIFSNPNM